MHIRFWGTRGSLAKPGPTTIRYGGNTSCVEVRSNSGTQIVLDCGTGAHSLGQHLVAEQDGTVDGHMLISHTHWDHIQGIPFFAPFFEPGSTWNVYGPRGLSENLRATLAGQMEHTYFPITLDQFEAKIIYRSLVEGGMSIDGIDVKTFYLNHPALTLGYRLEADGVSLVYCCDHEPYSATMASGEAFLTAMERRYVDFLAGADLVIHDAQYTAQEYPSKIGWGHSPVEYVVRVCREAGVKQLALTHYDPLRDDSAIDSILEEARAHLYDSGSQLQILGAAEGLILNLEREAAPSSNSVQQYFATATATDTDLLPMARPVFLRVADNQLLELMSDILDTEGLPYRVLTGSENLSCAMRQGNPSLVVVEHNPPLIDGLDTVHAIRFGEARGEIQVPVVLVTNTQSIASEDSIATDWLVAPFSQSYARAKIRSWVLRSACHWVRAQLPADEADRIGALHGLTILDTPAEERFDRLTRIAAVALDLPITLVSLVDTERQWFKSCFGLDTLETSRDVSFCAHVIHQKVEMIVQDTLLDERFADNPLVLGGPRIRAYMGIPLMLADGSCIGTFCVIDTRPREFSDTEVALLRDLRDLALAEIKRRLV